MSLTYTQAHAIEHARKNGATIIRSKLAAVTFALETTPSGRIYLKAWRGPKVTNHSFYFGFPSIARAQTYAADYVRKCQDIEARAAKALAEKKAKRAALDSSHHWAVGDTVYTSWGYDQTNVDFFQIVRLKPRSVVVRQVRENNSDNGGPSGGKTAPRRFDFIGPEVLCPLNEDGRFSAGPCHNGTKPSYRHSCYKWDGRSKYTSSYA